MIQRALSFLLALGCVIVHAQVTATGNLSGIITDQSEAVVRGAAVQISTSATGLFREITTGEAGTYRFDLLPPGTYTVKVLMTGFRAVVFGDVGVAVGQTTTIDATLSPSSKAETVTVEATGTPLVDIQSSDVRLLVNTSMVERLPLNGRDFVNLAIIAPGAKPVDAYDPTKRRMGVFAVNGSSGRNVNLTVNGIDDKDNTVGGPVMQMPLEAIQEFLISTQRFSAANGRSEGAAINVITKSGTNNLHGSLYFFDRHEALNALNYFEKIENGGSGEKSPYSREQFGGSIGGPVRKDHDFLFFTLEREREQTNIVTDPQAFDELSLVAGLGAKPARNIPTPYYDWRYNGRWDHRFNHNHNLFVSYSNQNNRGENDQSIATNDLTAGNFTTNQLILASVTFNSVLTPRVVNSFTAGYQYWNNLIDSTQRVPTVNFPNSIYFGTNLNVPQQSYQAKWQFRDDISITRGKHTFKIGLDYLWEPKLGGFFEFNPTPGITFLDLPSAIRSDTAKYPQGFSTPGAVTEISETAGNPYALLSAKMFGVYIQDDWKVSRRLTLNLGLRWDKDFNLIGGASQQKSRAYLALKAIGNPYAGRLPQDDNKDFSPRIGFAYDLRGSGRHIVRGGFGIYYGQTFTNIPFFMLQQVNPTFFATVFDAISAGPGDPNADILPGFNKPLSQWRYGVDPLPPVPPALTKFEGGEVGRLMDPYYHNPYTEQFNIGYAFQINDANVIELEYIHSLGLREPKALDINPKIVALNGARELDATFTGAGLPQLGRIEVQAAISRSRYDGFNLSYRRRLSNRFSINSSYVLSRAVAYNGSAAAFYNPPFDIFNYLAPTDLGPTPSDSTHRGVISGIFDMPWGILLSTTMQAESARPYNPTQGIDVTGQGQPSDSQHAILVKSSPSDYTATANMSAAELRACLAAGNCLVAGFDSLRGTPYFQWDIRAGKRIKFGERAALEVFFQGFDITNRANFGGNYNNNIRSSTFRTPNGFMTPSGVTVPHSFSGEFGAQFRF
jgi:outer membrane receptor protein involved in Fe transport